MRIVALGIHILLLWSKVLCDHRPFYNIAHMVNSIREVDHYLRVGANAIETDISFTSDGTAKWAFHGSPCDCFRSCGQRENIVDFFEYIRKITTDYESKFRSQLALLFLDLKTADLSPHRKKKAGEDLAQKLIKHLWYKGDTNNSINVLLSVPHIADKELFNGVFKTLMEEAEPEIIEKLGYDVGLNDPLDSISKMYTELGIDRNIWQGDGISNCISPFRSATRVKQAVKLRDSNGDKAYINKVYHWTIDLSNALRSSIRIGVDGIITNYPERVITILNESPFRHSLRLARPEDNPWRRVETSTTLPYRGDTNPLLSAVSDASEVVFQFWTYVLNRLRGRIFRRSVNY